MKICILSGKGGTGKTFVSTNLFNVIDNATYLDCDVEEPNGHIFFNTHPREHININKEIPIIDAEKCIRCKKCVEFCKFNSLALIGEKVYFFDEMCHSCGGCEIVCPSSAISFKEKNIGVIKKRKIENKYIYTGVLNVGEASGTKIIDKLLTYAQNDTIIDCPPGSDCSVIESIKDSNYSIIVTEPTIFGLHNMQMIIELLKIFNKKFGIIINKSLNNDEIIEKFAKDNNIQIIAKIPFSKELNSVNSNGNLITDKNQKWKEFFKNIYSYIESVV